MPKVPTLRKVLYREVIRMDKIIRFMLIWLARVINQNNNTINVPFL